MANEISGKRFFTGKLAGTAALAAASANVMEAAAAAPMEMNKQVFAALGPLFIPSRPGDPGYKELEVYGITEYVLQNLPATDALETFNTAAQQYFGGKTFLDLDEKQREQYLALIADGTKIADAELRARLQTFYRGARSRILTVYYKNYPEHEVKRNAEGDPVLQPGDTHQRNWAYDKPNTKKIATGWDVAGFKGPVTWEDEERLRAKAKKTLPYWYEGDLVKLTDSRPPAATAIKTSDGHDYYDVLVLGGGTAGCIVAGRLAERGVNPKTGDRLRVAMIEGGDDWTIRDPGIRPGHGYPIRRRMITNIPDGVGPEGGNPGPNYRYPSWFRGGPAGYNFRLVGGCSNHYGGTLWIPGEEDFHFYREASGVDWDLAKFGDAIQEVRDFFHPMSPPEAWWSKGDRLWADAGRALGYEMFAGVVARRNALGAYEGEYLSRVDAKGTALPWAYIGLNNGLKVIANAEVEKILIEKVPGGRPVATGAVYADKSGAMHELRAARVIVACSANWTPLLLYKSGYGPRDLLGDKLIVENKNVGYHLTGDCDLVTAAYLAEEVEPDDEVHGGVPWTSMKPKPWGELSVHIRAGAAGREPEGASTGIFAPAFGWEHKEYMRNGSGVKHIMTWRTHLGAIPWSWRVLPPDGHIERVELDEARMAATIKEASEVVRAWQGKLAIKPVKTDFRAFSRPLASIEPQHPSGTARAGASRETSVCTSDYDCHDIDNLLFTSSATIPRTFFWSCGPTAVNAAYAWRRMIANHFSTGSSTKGFA